MEIGAEASGRGDRDGTIWNYLKRIRDDWMGTPITEVGIENT